MRLSLSGSFGLDTRALAFFRVAFSFLLLVHFLGILMPVAEALLSDQGVLPRDLLLRNSNQLNHSLLLIGGTPAFVKVALLVFSAWALALFFGWKTRWMLFLSWLALVSVTNRNLNMSAGVEGLMMALCFWSLFLPLNRHWSVDRALSGATTKAERLRNWGSFAFVFQIMSVYVFTGLLKWHPIWVENGTALYRALVVRTFSTDFGLWLIETLPHSLLSFASKSALWLELIGPIVFLFSFWSPKLSSVKNR